MRIPPGECRPFNPPVMDDIRALPIVLEKKVKPP